MKLPTFKLLEKPTLQCFTHGLGVGLLLGATIVWLRLENTIEENNTKYTLFVSQSMTLQDRLLDYIEADNNDIIEMRMAVTQLQQTQQDLSYYLPEFSLLRRDLERVASIIERFYE